MNTTNNKVLMTIKESKKKSISQIAAIGRKYKILKYPILLSLVLFIFVYNFAYYFCLYFKMKERTVKAVAMAMCVVLCVTSIDITALAYTGDAGSDKEIVGISSLSEEIANQMVKPDATLEDIKLPESLDVHVSYQVEKEIEVEVEEEEKATPTPTPSVEPTPSAEPTPSVEVKPTEEPKGEEVKAQEETNKEENQESDEPEQNVPADEPTEESNQLDDTQNEDIQNEDTESQPDGEQLAKISNGEYDRIETVYVPMTYYAAEPSENEVVVENLEKDETSEETVETESQNENNTVIKKEIVIEEVEEDVSVSVEWSIDEENSSKTEFKDLEAGEEYIFVPTITEDGYRLAEEAELPVIKVTVEDGKAAAFEQSITVDGVVITVTADEGVFPEDATIEARKVTTSEEKEVEEAIDEVRDEEKNVAVSYTFDITAYDQDGNEIEPDTSKGSVKVTFKMAEIANENLETDVYHLAETSDGLNAENLDVNTDEGEADEATVETTGFSFYTVEFTYKGLQYVLDGGERVELSAILGAVGIKENGAINKVEVSKVELFKPVLEGDTWYIESLKSFETEEWLKVTIDGIEYEIVVTDSGSGVSTWADFQSALSGTDETITLGANINATTGNTTLVVSGTKTLDLNGYTINGKIDDSTSVGSVIKILSGATLTLKDDSTGKTGKITGGNSTSGGGGVYVDGTLNMYGGTISGNMTSTNGGGVYVRKDATFNMYEGSIISGNSASTGGGVIAASATFNMYGGTINGNTASASGGGVSISGTTNFTMSGGTISGNNAKNIGGIMLTSGSFTMTGGEVSGNSATTSYGGIFGNGTITVGGTAVITDNKFNGKENNVNLNDGQTITIADGDGVPAEGMKIRVTLKSETGCVTGEGTGQYARYFGSDDVTKAVVNKNDQVQIVSKDSVVACVNHDGTLTYCDSLQDAVNAAVSEDTAQLLRDIDGEDISVDGAKEITLDLNGKVLKGTETKSVVTIKDNAKLTLEDSGNTAQHYDSFADLPAGGVITGGKTSHGGGVLIMGGSFTMKAGTICRNTATNSGGGVCVGHSGGSYTTSSEFVMNGGTITGNVGTLWGGGVCVGSGTSSSSTFTMNGGLISNNSSVDGGGVHVGGNGSSNTFNMCGGTISGNNATGNGEAGGGGVSVYLYNDSTQYNFVMTGGTITGNTANGNGGGANIRTGSGTGILTVGGTAKILNNKKNSAEENIYIGEGKSITVGTGKDAPKNGMFVGVTLYGENGNGSGYVTDTTGTVQYAQYFNSDNSNYKVFYKDGRVYIGTPTGSGDVLNMNAGKQYETIASAIDEASSGDTIQLLGDITENVTVTKDITLDLNGYKLKGTGSGSVVFVNESAKLTLEDGSQEKTGKITGGNSTSGGGGVYVDGTLNMYGGTISGNMTSTIGGGLFGNGTITVGDTAKITGNTANGASNNVYLGTNKTIDINTPSSGMSIGVTMQTPGVFTTNTADGYLSYFSSDDSNYKVIYDTDKKLKLAKKYNVIIDSAITNGTVTTDVADGKAIEGDTVNVTPTPNTGYTLKTLKYNDGTEDHNITATSGAYTFVMPAKDVTIKAEFVLTTKPASTVTTAPTAKSLTYNGADQALVTEGTASGGTMNYVIGDNATTAPTTGWSTSVPTGKNAGTYYVWYKSVGDSEHSDSEPVCVTVTLAKANHMVTVPTALNPTYNGSAQTLISAGSCTTGTIKYSLDGTNYFESVDSIKKTEVGSYTVYYKVEGDGNYETYGPKSITAKIVKKSDPTPTPTPTPKPDPKPTPSPSEPDPQPTIPIISITQYAETGNLIKNYVANNPTGSNIPLPYITTDVTKAGWKTIDDALDAHKAKYKKNAVGTLNVTMNGSATVDTELITDAHEKEIPLSFALDDEVAVGIPVVNSVLSDQTKEGKKTYFNVSSMTTIEAVSAKKVHAGLLPSDIVSIGGDANTPVVLTLCSNDKLSTNKSQLMTITFNAKKAGFKMGNRVYLYCGTSQIGIAMYKTGKVDKNGFVTFSVPMVSNYWTIGSENMKNKLLRNAVSDNTKNAFSVEWE